LNGTDIFAVVIIFDMLNLTHLTRILYRLLWVWDHLLSVVESAVQAGRISTFQIMIMHLKYRESASTKHKTNKTGKVEWTGITRHAKADQMHLLPLLIF